MKSLGLENVEEAKDFERLAPGGYICRITSVEDVPDKEYLKIEYDIAEGKYKDYWRELYKSKMFWGGSFVKSYKEKALPFFKAFVTAVENSNPSYHFNDQKEQELVGKLVGLVLGDEEYKANDGRVKTRTYTDQIRSVEAVRKGDFKIPDKKPLAGGTPPVPDIGSFEDESDDKLPF